MGDVIYALPTIRALGGGVLYLDPRGGLSSPLVKWAGRSCTKLNAAAIESIKPLLSCQPYIQEVRHWNGEPVDYDMDQFRLHLKFNNLSDSHLAAFTLPLVERDRAWITVDSPVSIPDRPVVIARSLRYHGNDTFWESILPQIKECAVFVGFQKEYEIFVYTFNHEITYWPTPDIMALTRVLAGCQQFIGNQGLPHAIAEALKKNLINEVFRPYPAAVFQRPGAQYV
ncbi:MAG: hypothetical protein M3O30_02045 [Planctomycetota bacterium]|nr:hypothetical protein [Planctomycetota bacterium]